MDAVWREYLQGFTASIAGAVSEGVLFGVEAPSSSDPFRGAPAELQAALVVARRGAEAVVVRALGERMEAALYERDLPDPMRLLDAVYEHYEPALGVAGSYARAVRLEVTSWGTNAEQRSALTRFAPVADVPTTDVGVRAVVLRARAELGAIDDPAHALAAAMGCLDEISPDVAIVDPLLAGSVELARGYVQNRLLLRRSAAHSHTLGLTLVPRLVLDTTDRSASVLARTAFAMFETVFALDVVDESKAQLIAAAGMRGTTSAARRLARDLGFDVVLDRLGLADEADRVRLTSPSRPGAIDVSALRAGVAAGWRFSAHHGARQPIDRTERSEPTDPALHPPPPPTLGR